MQCCATYEREGRNTMLFYIREGGKKCSAVLHMRGREEKQCSATYEREGRNAVLFYILEGGKKCSAVLHMRGREEMQ